MDNKWWRCSKDEWWYEDEWIFEDSKEIEDFIMDISLKKMYDISNNTFFLFFLKYYNFIIIIIIVINFESGIVSILDKILFL
jgi:hypothetical protein